MTIIDALKAEFTYARVTNGDKWLVWDGSEWVVYQKKAYQRGTATLYRGDSESDAVEALLNG